MPKAKRELIALARQMGPDVLRRIYEIAMTSPDEGVAVKAAEIILERGFGKLQAQPFVGEDPVEGEWLTVEQLAAEAEQPPPEYQGH